uniref:AB hydrolase-1 domain-containing protein n=2 Tax=Babesia bovis TaxID=5865 RepID=S6C8M0_BABBO|nr:conserved hypothetical protein [Babesia bovis]
MSTHRRDIQQSSSTGCHKCGVLCLYGCIHVCRLRDAIISKAAFKPPLRPGYTLDDNGNFVLDAKLWPTRVVSNALSTHGIEARHRFIPGRIGKHISAVLIQLAGDKASNDKSEGRYKNDRELVVFSHGNSTDIGYMFPAYVNFCRNQRVDILAYDYSGYGLSDGEPAEKCLYSDIEHVYKYVRSWLKVKPELIILYGNSLGSVPSSYLASMPEKYPIGGLILDAPLSSAIRLQVGYVKKTPRFDAFANIEYLKSKALYPTLVIHGTSDGIIPIEHARDLAFVVEVRHAELMPEGNYTLQFDMESSKESCDDSVPVFSRPGIELIKQPEDLLRTWWVPGAGHNNIQLDYPEAYVRTIEVFFKLCTTWRINRKG